MCWRRRAVVKSVMVMVVVQVFVAACVLSLWQLQQESQRQEQKEWLSHHEMPRRVGKYVLLFEVPSAPPIGATTHPTGARPHSAPRAGNSIFGYNGSVQVKRTDSLPDEGQLFKQREREQYEEEDPDVGRGFLTENVTYRSVGNALLLVDDDQRSPKTTKSTTSHNHKDSVMKNEVPQKKASNDDPARYRNSILRADESVEDDAAETKDYKFKSYDPTNPFKMTMRDDPEVYFQNVGDAICFTDGTDIDGSQRGGGGGCHCLEGYFGVDCGIPEAAWFDTYRNKYPETRLRRREVPRRVINGVTVNHEFAMFEARLHELYPVVDVFMVAESNYSAYGDPKELLFLERLRRGYMKDFQDKLLYVSLNTFPNISRDSGWVVDAYFRFHLGTTGIPLLKGLREDDLFVLSDADELPTREVITFLKLYDGYPEPISFALQWNMFGFFWRAPAERTWTNWVKGVEEQVSTVSSVATVGMLQKVLHNNAFFIRMTGLWQNYELFKRFKKYRMEGHLVKEWVIGKAGHYAGWHCSWCFSPANIVRKMDSAQANDEPRWGNMPEKKNLTYIASRISQGVWFDDKKHFLPVMSPKQKHYAPRYLLEHPTRYRSLLYNPNHSLNLDKPWAPP